MRTHLESQCKKYPLRLNRDKQSLLNFAVKRDSDGNNIGLLKNHVYKYEDCRKALAEMIIRDELSFRFVEGEGFIAYSKTLEPRFTIPSRVTIARDCMKIYGMNKLFKYYEEEHANVSCSSGSNVDLLHTSELSIFRQYVYLNIDDDLDC
ncbi:hypothetical protein POM88_018254 [Heracleum sosnowskyi]|uniref:Uncharacterized protein n=1 Tax=Heracleum sosnowskyi TaxID=360622 RepID=A0AAD8MYZ7_9APIA|nr:hypothetical protein POM88_018254 [Heracleum sosnowskyi]